jgi:hypothetical protein
MLAARTNRGLNWNMILGLRGDSCEVYGDGEVIYRVGKFLA